MKRIIAGNSGGSAKPPPRLWLFLGTPIVVCLLALAARYDWIGVSPPATVQHAASNGRPTGNARFADLGDHAVSADVRYVADWVADSGDAGGFDFVIVDKKNASVHVFNGNARLRGSTPVLLGSARGDESVPDIGDRPLSQVRPEERTTPAGRFIGERGHDLRGEDVVWVDYDGGVSMHRVITTNARERRLERLATPTIDDNRISYGCINVPVAFYEEYIRPTFANRRAMVYVLPEVNTLQAVFGSYDVAALHGLPVVR